MAVYILVGNTNLTAATAGGALRSFSAVGEPEGLATFLAEAGAPAVAASVNPQAEPNLARACRTAGIAPPLYAERGFPIGLKVAVSNPAGVGADRLLNVKAAFARAHRACVVVDFGTAISISAADACGAFVGGAILAGLSLSLRALHEAAAFLPEVEVAAPGSVLGSETVSAMRSGVVYGAVGAAEGIVRRVSAVLGETLEVFATGGDSRLLEGLLPEEWHVVSELAIEGLRLAYEESL